MIYVSCSSIASHTVLYTVFCYPDLDDWINSYNSYFSIPSQRSLKQAIMNVRRFYTLVGVLEDLDGFISKLEHIMPHMFHGMTRIFRKFSEYFLDNVFNLM